MTCRTCNGPVSRYSRTGLCRSCAYSDPALKAKRAAGIKRAFMVRPELGATNKQRLIEQNRTPEMRALSGRTANAVRLWEHGHAGLTPESFKRSGRTQAEKRLSDIPPEMRDEYWFLTKRKRMTAAEAREAVMALHEKKMAEFRRKLGAG